MGLFSFLKKTFKRIEENNESKKEVSKGISGNRTAPKQDSVDIASVSALLEKKFDENFQSLREASKKSYEEIQVRLNELKESLANLEKAGVDKNLDSETLRLNRMQINLANLHRKSFIQKMELMMNQLNQPLGSDLSSVLSYQQRSSRSVAETNVKSTKDYGFFESFLPRESKETLKTFKNVLNAANNFDNIVHSKLNNINLIKKAQNEFSKLKEKIKNSDKNKKQIKELNKKLKEWKSKKKSLEENLKKLESDKNFKHFTEKKKRMNSKLSETMSEISQHFSQINKPLKKFLYLVKKGGEKAEEKTLNKYLTSPADELLRTGNFNFINSILNKIRLSILDGKLEVKNKNKVLSKIKHIIDYDVFRNLVVEYNSVANELKKLEEKGTIKGSLKTKNELKRNLAEIGKEIDLTAEEIENIEKQIKRLSKSIEKSKNNLAEMLDSISESYENVSIEIPR